MMQRIVILLICLIPFFCQAQRDVLVLERRGMHEKAYTVGDPLVFETIYGQWFNGTIEDLHHDTVYIAGQAFNYNEIAVIRRTSVAAWSQAGKYMMIVGGGFVAISAINGALRQDHPNEWFTTSGYIIGGVLLVGGFIATEFTPKYYKLGGRFKLTYLQLTK
ncbi:MAG TPA: hypothetical protein VFE32_20085 [Puia sp.]|jgi:hypothetical protein|nr:hypothetical protein [Puia sp.]